MVAYDILSLLNSVLDENGEIEYKTLLNEWVFRLGGYFV